MKNCRWEKEGKIGEENIARFGVRLQLDENELEEIAGRTKNPN